MTSKQRAYLKSISSTYDPVFQIGKSSITPEICDAVSEALAARELIKLNVLKNCADDPKDIASVLAERTRSNVVHVIGRKIVLYRPNPKKEDRKIILPKD
ncbi:MAG: ribosome assembly RNA-binding protein YhbY [Lachnospiraceae bacterium]|jgi:RNA-binding protein|nr:ribosome assembly RNA-binding protein YhbY [Lachnospiraceae bacterium]MBQ8667260.1 ribosome assembly RNA-binding protein YhbY [Lachnospiraceae bacterium]